MSDSITPNHTTSLQALALAFECLAAMLQTQTD